MKLLCYTSAIASAKRGHNLLQLSR